MQLVHIIDPRDALDRASRDEVFMFCNQLGIKQIDGRDLNDVYNGGYAKERMVRELRRRGITNIRVAPRQLGQPYNALQEQSNRPPMMLEDLMFQEPSRPVQEVPRQAPKEDASSMPIGKLKKHIKELGIKQARTDSREALLEKLKAHGQQNPA
jgi:hypothetical protein